MEWRRALATLFFLILLGLVLYMAIQVTPAVRNLPEVDVPPEMPVPMYGQLPTKEGQWGKYLRMWNGEYRVVAPLRGYNNLFIDGSGNVIYPFE